MNVTDRMPRFLKSVDWPFLCFLIGVTNVKLLSKIVFITLYGSFLLYRKTSPQGILKSPFIFYLLLPLTGLAGAVYAGTFGIHGYKFSYMMSTINWMMCAASFALIYMTIKRREVADVRNAIALFFILNAFCCVFQLVKLGVASHHLFPYLYDDPNGVYGISTGDHLYGIFINNTSTVNAAINSLGVIWFLFAGRYRVAAICLLVCLFCASNAVIMILLTLLAGCFLFYRERRKVSLLFIVAGIAVYLFISPQNVAYTKTIFAKLGSSIHPGEKKAATANVSGVITGEKHKSVSVQPQLPPDVLADVPALEEASSRNRGIHPSEPFDRAMLQHLMQKWYVDPYGSTYLSLNPQPGKLFSFRQTYRYLMSDPGRMLLGAGPGNFSSRMAWRTTGLTFEGSYPKRYRYISHDYYMYHFYTQMYYLAKPVSEHSVFNAPNSVYNQLAGEYGLLGICLFLVLYCGFFVRVAMKDKRKFIFILALLGLFIIEYWFEMLTLTVFFELFMMCPADDVPAEEVRDEKLVMA